MQLLTFTGRLSFVSPFVRSPARVGTEVGVDGMGSYCKCSPSGNPPQGFKGDGEVVQKFSHHSLNSSKCSSPVIKRYRPTQSIQDYQRWST